ncbi:MtrAB system accessory lipoprotein LpqB [Corynebacterium macclintockiae]|uniref:MtrAB system accessory lipoprotein LpqB n=1 Tax=Corynebacterium macclintockiae TaxID=2913501 RepID=UPI00254D8C19|nr:MtrAB system accessory lipoprotein LpqB [Corynebacterium macclintockiae]MDK8869824.1 MtrAB system accessory lipoprotein LpqB [Corynebacterium macclintockiae]
MSNKTMKVLAAVTGLGLIAACSTLPDNSRPEAISSYAPAPSGQEAPTPGDGQAADLLLRDFFTASAHPLRDHQAAKKFLTPGMQNRWQSNAPTMVLDRIDIASEGEGSDTKITYRVRGNIVGNLGVGGVFDPQYSAFETNYELQSIDGQWRISNLPNVVVLDRQDFLSTYRARNVYFPDLNGRALVPDRRWIYTGQQSTAASLVSLLVAGPQERLKKAVRNLLPEDATAQVSADDEGDPSVNFSGIEGLSPDVRRLLAAQVVWTLAGSEVRGPYELLADGTPMSDDMRQKWLVQDLSEFDPNVQAQVPLRAVSGGDVYQQDGARAKKLDGWLADRYVESVALSPRDEVYAAVTGRGDEQRQLVIGGRDEQPVSSVQAKSLTRPTWGLDATTLYVVVDGEKIVQITRNPETGIAGEKEVDAENLKMIEGDEKRISVFRVSHDGTRAVMVVNGRVYVSVLETTESSNKRLGSPVEIGSAVGDTAVSADWTEDGSVLVGTRANDAPVWDVEVDGSYSQQITGRNLAAPVVSVATDGNKIYVTDANALMQFDVASEESRFWREVPTMQGKRATPVLAD